MKFRSGPSAREWWLSPVPIGRFENANPFPGTNSNPCKYKPYLFLAKFGPRTKCEYFPVEFPPRSPGRWRQRRDLDSLAGEEVGGRGSVTMGGGARGRVPVRPPDRSNLLHCLNLAG